MSPPDDNSAPPRGGIWGLAAGFFIAALAQRLPFLGFNRAEYTDGILMIGRDIFGATYWPPLYTWATWALGPLAGGDLEIAGQLVSIIGGAAAVVPLVWLAGEFGGATDARDRWRLGAFAGAFYLASPMAWRWGVRVMSDALFLALFWGALAYLAASRNSLLKDGRLTWRFAAANLLGALSALTRHQGVFLTPLAGAVGAWGAWRWWRSDKKNTRDLWPLLTLAFWLAWPLTQLGQAQAHTDQVTFRAGLGADAQTNELQAALLALANLTESFIYLAPYFFTPLIWLFAIIGATRRPGWDRGGKTLAGASALLAAMILGSQGLFQSFLSRYLLPLLPIVLLYAARGAAFAEDHWKPWVYRGVFLGALAWGVLFGLGSLVFQRDAFADLKDAAVFIREDFPADAPVYANEIYMPEAGLHAIKATWWLGREVHSLRDSETLQPVSPPPRSVIILSSAYAGGPEGYARQVDEFVRGRGARVAMEFNSRLLPLLPDIMMSPQQGHQSPLAWVYRYQPQEFRTAVLVLP